MKKIPRTIKTKGIVIRPTSRKHYWTINLPNREEWYGGINTSKLQSLIFYIGAGFSVERASKLAGFGRKREKDSEI